jgi:iron complex transport system ATP-binding protein
MLALRDLSVGYGSREIIKDLSLHVQRGQVTGLIGPNGAGKTSLIRAVSGVLRPRSGSIQLDGEDLNQLNELERALRVAVVPQSTQLALAFSVYESVALGRTPHLNWLGRLGESDRAKIEWALANCELTALKDRRSGELSGGEQQRVVLARALAQDCPVLLLDEPTAHLDLHHQVGLLSLVRRLSRDKNLAVLVAMHDLNLAALYADQLALLVDGEVRAVGTPQAVLTPENLQKAYQVPLGVYPNPQHGLPWVVLQRS